MTRLPSVTVTDRPLADDISAAVRTRGWVTPLMAAIAGAAVVGLLVVLWLGMAARDRGTVGVAAVPFKQAPDFTLTLFDGSTFQLSSELARGKPVLVNFWASWCVPCADEAPVLEAGWRRYKDRATFVGVDVQDQDADARAFINRFGVSYANGAGNAGPISVSYGMRGVPESYFIAPDGHVVRKWNGPLTDDGLNQFMDELLRASNALGR